MISVCKGKAILQMPCGCNSRKFNVMDATKEQYESDMEEISDFVDNHSKICWSGKGKK